MLRNIFAQITPHLRRRNGFLQPQPLPLIQNHLFESIYVNKTAEEWLKQLPEDQMKRVRLIQNEIALKMTEMKKTPALDRLTIADYEEMLEMSTSRRQKYYHYLFVTQTADTRSDMKKKIRDLILEEKKANIADETPKHIDYGLGKNTLLLKVTNKSVITWRNRKLHRALLLNEPPLVFDCGFQDVMSKYEIRDAARQLKYAFSENRLDRRPFVMHLCNMNKDSKLWHELAKEMLNIEKLPIKVHSEDITEVFPSKNLVYLSPDAEDVIQEFNEDNTYVVGGLVDKATRTPVTLAKAKRLNIRSMRLPLDKHIKFHSHKTLTLDQMILIMLELKRSQDWKKALQRVPKRKIFG
ncbi:mitochondrial ribonuclease P protein 1 homolog [Sitodiplosis mosellana]|uniref:mitochondrial ribonuclease P protein 1 homolog n=1 Tax=Sitodiplosis mosellana TaxID=263140 RepID=UPI002444C542|nr:mitochondrial ribonuclease P protein 1 homolog [Sitodiplosis mosellana]